MDDAIRACLRSGDTQGAQAAVTAAVKAQPAESRHRVALFQLLCVHGAWERALGQLREASAGGGVRNRPALLTKILKDLAAGAGIALR